MSVHEDPGLIPRLRAGWFEGMVSAVEPRAGKDRAKVKPGVYRLEVQGIKTLRRAIILTYSYQTLPEIIFDNTGLGGILKNKLPKN